MTPTRSATPLPSQKAPLAPQTPQAPLAPVTFWLALALTALLAFGLPLSLTGIGDLFNETDGQYASAARVMAEGGSWMVPENNGVPRLNKPPLLVWFMAVSFSAGGINEVTARLPTALGVGFWVLGVFLLGAAWGGPWRGAVAALMLLTALGTGTLGRLIMPEPWFCAGFTWALYAVWRAMEDDGTHLRWGVLFWTAMGVSAAVKGWHGFVLPGGITVLTLWWCGRREALRGLLLCPPGWVVAVVLVLPWLLLMEMKFPGFLRYFFFDEALGHALGSQGTDTSYDNVPRGAFFLLHVAWFFPWILVAGAGLGRWREWRWPTGPERLFWVWGVTVGGIVMLAGQRQDYYAMMGWPVFFLFSAWAWETAAQKWPARILAGLGAVGLLLYWMFPWWQRFLPVQTATMAERATAWSTLAGFDRSVWEGLLQGLFLVSAGFLVAGVAASLLWPRAGKEVGKKKPAGAARTGGFFRARRAVALACWLAAAGILSVAAAQGMARIAPWFSHAETARWILQRYGQAAAVAYEGGSDTGSSLYYYLGHPVYLVQESPQPEFAARVHGHGAEWTIRPEELALRWEAGEEIYLVTETLEIPTWQIRHPGLIEVYRASGQAVLRPGGR